MTNIYLIALMSIASFSFFSFSLRLSALNRAVLNTPISLFEKSIPIVQGLEELTVNFDKPTLERNVSEYYEHTIKNFTNNYTIDFYYYNKDDYSYCVSENCDAVEITIKASVFLSYKYERSLFYEIRDGAFSRR